MIELAVGEALRLMLGPPMQLTASRHARAKRESRVKDAARWQTAQEKLQEALQLLQRAAQSDGSGA